MNPTIGVVAALPGEARAIAGFRLRRKAGEYPCCRVALRHGTALMVVQSGMGSENAFSAAEWLSEKGVAVLGCFGVSGGLHPVLKAGDVVFGEAVFEQRDGAVFPVWKKDAGRFDETFKSTAAEDLIVRRGPIITVQTPVPNTKDKKALFDKTNALAVDMESAAVARAANQSGLPFFAFRTICDPAHVSLPETLCQWVDRKGSPRIFYMLRQILLNPSLISDLLRMKRNFAAALAVAPRVRRCLSEMCVPCAPS